MFALAVLDLPFEAGQARRRSSTAGKMTLTPGRPGRSPSTRKSAAPPARTARCPILVSQNFYRHGDRFREENGEKLDKFVTDEFVIHTVYGCQVVVTNPTSSRQTLTVLLQLPDRRDPGRQRPVHQDRAARPRTVPHADGRLPLLLPAGRASSPHFPVHVAKNETARRRRAAVHVRRASRSRRKLDTESWDYVSQNGTDEEVLAVPEPRERAAR